MLEIQGAYSKNENAAALKVLAQFDNGILHIWHQSEPFFLLLSCSAFSISASHSDPTGTIKLNTGGWIETSDLENLKKLKKELKEINRKKPKKFFKSRELVLIIALLFLFFTVWFLSQNGA